MYLPSPFLIKAVGKLLCNAFVNDIFFFDNSPFKNVTTSSIGAELLSYSKSKYLMTGLQYFFILLEICP